MSKINWNFENTYFNLPGSFKEEKPKTKAKKPLIKAPKPKGYNAEVDGPREVIPNPKYVEAEAKIN